MKPRNVTRFAMVAALAASLTMLTFDGTSFAAAVNVLNAHIYGGPVGQHGVDQPFGHVTVCVPGTANCQNVGGLLIDTGSFGLRIFSQALTIKLPEQTSGPDQIAECAFFGSFTAWGGVATADVTMGGEPVIHQLPVQIIDANFPVAGGLPANCDDGQMLAQSPQQLNFNGILGVGLRQYDGASTTYYACTATTCTRNPQPQALQVQNPVALLPRDNNGVMLEFPLPPADGAATLTGQLIFGINTRFDNQIPAGFKVYTADANSLNFTTVFQNIPRSGFIDSGSNGFFYDNPALRQCHGSLLLWYCPPTLTAQDAINTGSDENQTGTFHFEIANAFQLFLTGNTAFSNLGANFVSGPGTFDWGLPFFIGRRVFVGIAGKSIPGVSESTPLWAFKSR
jgi:hypothetical protein